MNRHNNHLVVIAVRVAPAVEAVLDVLLPAIVIASSSMLIARVFIGRFI